MAAPVKAVVFDSDGTLIDGFSVIADAYAHVAALHGRVAPTQEAIKAQLSLARPLPEIYRTFFPGGDIEQMVRENGEYFAANAMRMPGFDGMKEMLEALRAHGLMLGILTGGNHRIHDLLSYHDIEKHFVSIVHCDRVSRAKPDPEGFLLAMEECGTIPSEAIMVGDSANDIFAGKNAGARYTIGVTHGHGSRQSLVAADPDFIVQSLPELSDLILRLAG